MQTYQHVLQLLHWLNRGIWTAKTSRGALAAKLLDDLAKVTALDLRDLIFGVLFFPSQLLQFEMLQRSIEYTQYTSIGFELRCKEADVRPSMGSVGDCYDNAMCESFFATRECELLQRQRFKAREQVRLMLFEFIEGWYNPHRRHSSLDY